MNNLLKLRKNKSSQSLPLNTIVIALLVVIVLLVIILFFTGSFSNSGKDLDNIKGTYTDCSPNNPLLSDYINPTPQNSSPGSDWERVIGMSNCWHQGKKSK